MIYTIKSDTFKNYDNGVYVNCYSIEAMSAIDAVIKASKNADDDEDVIVCNAYDCGDENGPTVIAYRMDDGSYEFHVHSDNGSDDAFTI